MDKRLSVLLMLCLGVAVASGLGGCAGGSAAPAPAPARGEENLNEKIAAAMQVPVPADAPQRAKVHTELGLAYLRDGRVEVALSEVNIALEADRTYALAHNLNALIQMNLRQNDKAEASFRQALGLAPNNHEISNNYGWFLCQTGRIKESFAYFSRAQQNPLNKVPSRVLHNMGVCSLMDKNDTDGESYLFRSVKLDPNNLRAYYLLAELNYRRGRLGAAKDWLRQLHGKMEPSAETLWLALRIDRKLGDRSGEARYTGLLKSKFRDSVEYQQFSRGEFD